MTPLSDRTVVVALLASVALVFALVFWAVRSAPPEAPLLWREGTPERRPIPTAPSQGSTPPGTLL